MPKVAVVTDIVACLPRELVEHYGIRIVPVNFYFGDKLYRDWVDITPSEAYQLFLKDPTAFKTSGINPGECLEAYRQASQRAKDILCLTLSTKLSGAYDAAKRAIVEVRKELPQLSVAVVDTKTVTAAEGFVALAARAAEADGSLAEAIEAAEGVRSKVCVAALMDTIRYVYRSGRMPKIARDRVGRRPVHMAVMHAYAPDDAERLKERVAAEFNCAELWVTEFSPVMGYACGTGTLGVAFYPDG